MAAMDHADFPWQPLGALLLEDELLSASELHRALAEQRRTGRLLGQILVEQGAMTGVELARTLARQHGVELRTLAGEDVPTAAPAPASGRGWRSLGTVLVENDVLSYTDLAQALAEQRERPERRLGEILVERGRVSAAALASALAEQHGVSLETQMLAAHPATPTPVGPAYRVCAVAYAAIGERRAVLYEGPNLLDAADFACDYIDREQPAAVEIERQDAHGRETVWTYSRERAAAATSSSKSLVETFGFDPARWDVRS